LIAIYIVLIVLVCIILWQMLVRLGRRFIKFPAPAFIGGFLNSGLRRRLQPPEGIIADSDIRPGMTILEIGCGSGAFTIAAARAVGPGGRVYALDIEERMLRQLERKLAETENSEIRNIELLNKSAYELPFKDGSLDLVFMVTVFQEIPDKQRVLKEIQRVLKPSGILAISEWLVDPDYPWKSTTRRQVEKAGFKFEGFSGNLWSYTVRFIRP
jgi:ubiquinone/menaquinone biosynthesis C-methylase UbiE